MTLLRYDASNAIDSNFGVSERQLSEIAVPFERLREKWICRTTSGATLLSLPTEQGVEYAAKRESSTLGRIFATANGLHDEIDAVVVLGNRQQCLGPRAIVDACCAPYHNELSRAERGSKPRIYFAGNDFDNDAAQAVLNRITASGDSNSPTKWRWGIVLVYNSPSNDHPPLTVPPETLFAFRVYLWHLCHRFQQDSPESIARRIVLIGPESEMIEQQLQDCLSEFSIALKDVSFHPIPSAINPLNSVLSPVGLMPAAMLGLDCMKLLEGAVAMSEHFSNAKFSENIILQQVAVNYLLGQDRGRLHRVINVWSTALSSFARWWERKLATELGVDATLCEMSDVEKLLSNQSGLSGENLAITQFVVDSWRTDPLRITSEAFASGDQQQRLSPELVSLTMPQQLVREMDRVTQIARLAGCPLTRVTAAKLDTHTLGQWLQMQIIATQLERAVQTEVWNGPAL